MLDVLAAAHLRVVHLAQVGDAEGYRQAQQERDGKDVAAVGGGRHARRAGTVHDAGVVGSERLRQLVLLTLLQQEQVKRLLHLLLALHAQKVLGLRRVRSDARHRLRLAAPQRLQLRVQRYYLVVDGAYDGLALGSKLAVDLRHQGVLLR